MLPDNFWPDEHKQLLAIIQPRLEQMAFTAQKHAAVKAGISFNPTLANETAASWASEYSDSLLTQLMQTTVDGVGKILSDWIGLPGATMGNLRDSLAPLFGQVRADRIAVTETTRAFAEGERLAYENEGIEEWRWNTNEDELVCEFCGEVDGDIVPIGEPFGQDANGDDVTQPPYHVECRCWISPVIRVRKLAKGDVEGHEFHGNQWTGGEGGQQESRSFRHFSLDDLEQDKIEGWKEDHEQQQDWITPATATPEEKNGLDAYKDGMYYSINTGLRTSGMVPEEFNAQYIAGIDSAMAKSSVSEDMTVYRGVRESTFEQNNLLGLKPGDTFTDKGFMSTTLNQYTAQGAARDKGAVFEINVPAETHGIYLDDFNNGNNNHEREILLDRGQQMRINSVDHNGNGGRLTFRVEIIRR